MWTQRTFPFGVILFSAQLLRGRPAGAVIAARGLRALEPGLDAGLRRSPWHPPAERATRPAGTSFSASVAGGARAACVSHNTVKVGRDCTIMSSYLAQWAFIASGALLAAVALTVEAIRAWGPRP